MKSLCLSLLATIAVASSAFAEPPRPSHITELPEMDIVGTPQRPSAIYVLNRSNPDRERIEMRTRLVDEVPRTVRRAPF